MLTAAQLVGLHGTTFISGGPSVRLSLWMEELRGDQRGGGERRRQDELGEGREQKSVASRWHGCKKTWSPYFSTIISDANFIHFI